MIDKGWGAVALENVGDHETVDQLNFLLSKHLVIPVAASPHLIASAVQRRASDIHVRPGEHGADSLYRNVPDVGAASAAIALCCAQTHRG